MEVRFRAELLILWKRMRALKLRLRIRLGPIMYYKFMNGAPPLLEAKECVLISQEGTKDVEFKDVKI